ncbi:hypothetical protein ACFL18_01540 [Patescibacteria group bacterium]
MDKIKQTKIFPEKNISFTLVKNQVDVLVQDPVIKIGLRVGFLSLGLGILVLALGWLKLPPEVPLLYSRPYGESQLVPNWGLWLIPVISLIIEIVSMRAAGMMFEKEKLLAQILIYIGTLSSVMGLITLVKIVLLMI